MKNQKLIIILFLFASLSIQAFSQNYMREAGFRGGLTSGLTYRYYLEDNLAYEALLSFRNGGMQMTLMRQIREVTLTEYADNLYFTYGLGAHAGFFYTNKNSFLWYNDFYYTDRKFSPVIGIDGYAGIEYRVDSFPITVGLDYKPFFEFSTQQIFRIRIWDLGLTLKYRF
jgi:hypothetical protein